MNRGILPARLKNAIKVLIGRDTNPGAYSPEPIEKLTNDAGNYWSSSQEDNKARDMSHWRGTGRWADDKRWLSVGEAHFGMYKDLLHLADRAPAKTMVEWGPGGGANAVRFGPEVERFYGVDISAANLEKCGEEVDATGYTGFVPVSIDAADPESVLGQISEKPDFFLCTAVYQHFPGKEYGIRITGLAHRLLADDGVALIQTRYDDGNATFAPKSRDYQANFISFTSYRIEEFWKIAVDTGFRPLAVILRPTNNYAFYLLSKS